MNYSLFESDPAPGGAMIGMQLSGRETQHAPNRGPRVRRAIVALLAAATVFLAPVAQAQTVPTGFQDYFVLGHEQHVWGMMNKVVNGPPGGGQGGGPLASGMNSLITAVASADNQIIYYDHWEDGLEADIFNPVQPSTLVIGDGNPGNGDACDFNNGPCGVDLFLQGDFANFGSNQGLLAGCTVPSASPLVFTQLCSSVPVNPRCAVVGACTAAEVRFDGGDFIKTSGGPLSIVHSQDPLTQFIGGSTEMLSKQAVAGALSYSIPVGEDLYPAFGCPNCVMEPFHYVALDLVAFEDGTNVFVNSPGAGTVSFTLNKGEHWSSLGFIDGNALDPTIRLTINSGTKVSTTAPIAGMLFTGGDGTWATRHYTLLPDILHSTDYLITAPGDDPAVLGSTPNRPMNLYLFNPNPFTPVTVTAADTAGTTAIVIPPNSVVDYFTGTGRFPPNGSTVRMTSNRNFWGISAYDYNTNISDWGHSWLATKFLTQNYTVSFAPGTLNPPVDMVNLSAVFVAATADNTRVQVDFDNDGVFDVIDFNGDGVPDPAPLPGNTYLVNALQSLRVFDPNDFDNTGTRIVANKPVSVAWGQDTDLTDFGDTALDTGYTVYPTNQLFLDPVLRLDKDVAVSVVPTAGGTATYTLTISTFSFGPTITNLVAYDLLPSGVVGGDYLPGSTLVTYPDLSQDTTDPVPSIDPVSGRDRLDWTLSPNTMGTNQTLTIRYSVNIPAAPGGTPRVLTNEGHARGNLGASIFSPSDQAAVIQTDLVLTKSVADDGTPQPGDVLTYTLNMSNNGLAAETTAIITDAIPPNTTFVPASITSSGPFAGVYSGAQNAVVWTAANFPVGGPHVLTFQVRVNAGVPAGTAITNTSTFESLQTPLFPSNDVDTIIVGPELKIAKTGPALLHPNEIATFNITVENTGAGAATNVLIRDFFPNNATYVGGSMERRLNAGPFISMTDAADADQGTAFVDRLELAVATLGAGEDLTFRFKVQVDPGTGGLFVNNQANVSSTETLPKDTNLVQVPIVGNAAITGHVFLDLDGNGVQGAGEPDLANVDVVVTDAMGNMQTVSTDGSGNYLATVEPGPATLDVDETDPDFPAGAALTTANDPQMVIAVSAATVAATPVGYDPAPFSFSKTSSAPLGGVAPGEILTYTLTATNNSGVDQTTVTVSDPLPTGTLAVPGSTMVTFGSDALRVTEYFIASGSFAGTVFDLTLGQNLVANYFVIVQGSDGDGGDNNRGPDENYARLTQDPFGTGALGASAGANVIRLQRGNAVNSWVGVVTVVECLSDCGNNGFVLRDVRAVAHGAGSTGGAVATVNPWPDINQVMLVGGFNGSGCSTAEANITNTKSCHARIFPSGVDQVNWTRDAGGATLGAATSTVMVVDWGTAWTVQRRRVQGNNGGNGVNVAGEYNTAAINPVARDNTWVWGTGHTNDQGSGDSGEGVVLTLGNGVTQNATESLVAAGIEFNNNAVDFEVYALTHPDLAVDYRFKTDGDQNALTVDVTVDAATANRMALSYNGLNDTGDTYPRSMFSARYLNDTTVRLERRRANDNFPAWVQGIDFSAIAAVTNFVGGDPSSLVTAGDSVTLTPGATITITFQVQVDPNLAPGITQIMNTATLDTDQETPINASVTDPVVRPAVVVEPNNAGVVVFNAAPRTITYNHVVTNTGGVDDSYVITAFSELGFANPGAGWIVELIDPDTGAVMAVDTDFSDATWDGSVIVNTGTLIPGEAVNYRVRVTVPGGTIAGTEETTTLTATSDRLSTVFAFATDETIVVGAAGPVIVTPDHSGVVTAGGSVAYSHLVINNTGTADTFDLAAQTVVPLWTATIYWDTNGDGVFSPGDLPIVNTQQIPAGGSQLIFVVVTAPAGASTGDLDVTQLTALSRNDPTLPSGAATDTTTVVAAASHDLSGGGTQLGTPGATSTFPGTIKNIGGLADGFDISISPSNLLGFDGLLHPTQLWVDTDNDGVPDTQIAEDTDGDGTWDTIAPGFNVDADAFPDVAVAAGTELAYELRRPVDPVPVFPREFVTLTATSQTSAEADSVTATVLLAVVTRVTIEGVRIDPNGVVEFATGMQRGTRSFNLYQTSDHRASSGRALISLEPVPSPRTNTSLPTLYRVETAPITEPYVIIEEIERDGDRISMGPFRVGDETLAAAYARVEALFDRVGVPQGIARSLRSGHLKDARARQHSGRSPVARWRNRPTPLYDSFEGVRVLVDGAGVIDVPLADLATVGLDTSQPRTLKVTNQGREVPFRLVLGGAEGPSISFLAEPLATDFTRTNVYIVAPRRPGMSVALTVSSVPLTPGALRIEKSNEYGPAIPLDQDPWVWDFLVGDGSGWPYVWSMPDAGTFDVPNLAGGATGVVPLDLSFIGFTEHAHSLTAYINGAQVGTLEFSGPVRGTLHGSVPAAALFAAGNQLSIVYSAVSSETGFSDPEAVVALDYLELHPTPSVVPLGPIAPSDILPFDDRLPRFLRVDYLIITDPLFREQADRLAGLKELDGLRPVVVETEQAYDRFSGGIPEPRAIQALIREASRQSRRLRFVVLIGDDTFDPLDNLASGAHSFVPSINAWDGQFGRVPSEHPYADLDDDGLPDLALGRIPVQTLAQATAVVDKIETQKEVVAANFERHVFAVDNHIDGVDVPFAEEADSVVQQFGLGSAVWSDIASGIDAARSNLRTGWQTAGMVHYFGHGGPSLWADENLLSSDTVFDLSGASQPALVFTWGCQAQWHQYLFGPSVNEALLLLPGGGASATFGPAGITTPASQQPLYQRFYAHLFNGAAKTLGEVVKDAKRQALVEAPQSRFAVEGFLLFGDPALPLPRR